MRSSLSTLTVGPCVNALHVPALKEATLVVENATTRRTLQGYFGEEYEAPASAECVRAATGRKGPSQKDDPDSYCIIKHDDVEFMEDYDYYVFRATSTATPS